VKYSELPVPLLHSLFARWGLAHLPEVKMLLAYYSGGRNLMHQPGSSNWLIHAFVMIAFPGSPIF